MLKTKTWILIFSLVLGVCLILCVLIFPLDTAGSQVEILQNGVCLQKIDLDEVTAPYSFEIKDPAGGSNRILVEPGRICVQEADCPDGLCVHRGWLPDKTGPIVCLPHRLVIRLAHDSQMDALSQ